MRILVHTAFETREQNRHAGPEQLIVEALLRSNQSSADQRESVAHVQQNSIRLQKQPASNELVAAGRNAVLIAQRPAPDDRRDSLERNRSRFIS